MHNSKVQNNSGSEEPTEEQKQWFREKMPNDPFQNIDSDERYSINDATEDKLVDNHQRKKVKPKKMMSYKYSKKFKGPLYEAIILEGKSIFLTYEHKIFTTTLIEEESRLIRPPNESEYPYEPYSFANLEELNQFVEKAKKQNIDSLYQSIKEFVEKYNDQDNYKLVLLATDILWSYSQDKFSTTHYIGVVGNNGSGKSTYGDTFESIGYRTVNITDPNAANLFRILDRIEPGQCTFVIDEADRIDESNQILSILKTGYQIRGKIPRTNLNTNEQEYFFTYCFKMLIAERSFDLMKAKGIHDRSFMVTTYVGNPRYDIKEIQKPNGIKDREILLDELNHLRKLLLIYRLIHYGDILSEIDIGLQGRDKELCKPILQLFHGSRCYDEVAHMLRTLLFEKNNRKGNSIEAALYYIVVNLVSESGAEISISQLWYAVKVYISGKEDERRPDTFHTDDYGTIYRNKISTIICDKFGADRKHKKEGNVLLFNKDKLAKIGKQYSSLINIKTSMDEFMHKV